MQLSIHPRPLLSGITTVDTGQSFVVMGGSAVCFSFGTFWNKGCFTITVPEQSHGQGDAVSVTKTPVSPWRFVHTIKVVQPTVKVPQLHSTCTTIRNPLAVSRLHVTSAEDFNRLLEAAQPVILEQLDIGPCSSKWTMEYLKEKVGIERPIIVHEATTGHMSFKAKNFAYSPRTFGEFLDQIDSGEKLYLRSLSSEGPSEKPANIATDFPDIAADFSLPPE